MLLFETESASNLPFERKYAKTLILSNSEEIFFTFEEQKNFMKYNYSFPTKLRVRYGETDQMGYCYYGNYAQYFEVGRVEALRALGMSYRNLEEQGIMLPVSAFTVKYIAPALYDDELTVITTISEINGPRIYFQYEIFNESGIKISNAETMLVFVDKKSMKPIAAPSSFLQLISPYEIN